MEIIALLFVLVIHTIGEPPLSAVQACAPQLVEVRQVEGKVVLKGTGEHVCFADIRG